MNGSNWKTRFAIRLFVALMGINVIDFATADGIRLQIQQRELRTSKSRIVVGDICRVHGGKSSTMKKIRELDLHEFIDNSPALITANHIRIRLRLEGYFEDEFTVSEGQVRVVPENQGWLETLISQTVQNELARQFGFEPADITVSVGDSKQLSNLMNSISHETPELTPLFGSHFPSGEVSMQFRYRGRTGRATTTRVPVEVTIFKNVYVTRQTVRKGQVISANAVFSVKRPIADSKLASFADLSCIGCTAKDDIAPHQVVLTQYLESPEVSKSNQGVRVNDFVDVVIQRGGIVAKLKNAKVRTAGKVGERVLVENLSSGQRFTAIVQDRQTLIIR